MCCLPFHEFVYFLHFHYCWYVVYSFAAKQNIRWHFNFHKFVETCFVDFGEHSMGFWEVIFFGVWMKCSVYVYKVSLFHLTPQFLYFLSSWPVYWWQQSTEVTYYHHIGDFSTDKVCFFFKWSWMPSVKCIYV